MAISKRSGRSCHNKRHQFRCCVLARGAWGLEAWGVVLTMAEVSFCFVASVKSLCSSGCFCMKVKRAFSVSSGCLGKAPRP